MLRIAAILEVMALPAALKQLRAPAARPTVRAFSTRPSRADRHLTPMELMLSSRSQLRSAHPVELLRVAGVTFEGRQAAVARLTSGQGLSFRREPDNPYDPSAVAISTLDGESIGYVPKERTQSFIHPLAFGRVASVGQVESSGGSPLWGCAAEVQPRVPPATVLAEPADLKGRCNVVALMDGAAWDEVKAEVVEAARGRCAVSGAPTAAVAERWEADAGARMLRLLGFVAQAPEVTRVERMLGSGEDLKEVLAVMNGWSAEDVKRYLEGVAAEAEARRGWRLDLAALKPLGLEVPDELREIASVES